MYQSSKKVLIVAKSILAGDSPESAGDLAGDHVAKSYAIVAKKIIEM
jgi:hypothetical protein